ncbi:MAG: purine-nucleoside phosphorylase [Acidobacteria bacterium]|nr:purine-nucleoside phosphorylase [Acidobacteriota bacterium]
MKEGCREALAVLEGKGAGHPSLAVLLGSGFGEAAASWPVRVRVPYSDIPGLPPCQVDGHAGELLCVDLSAGTQAWVFSGRLHAYEGHDPCEVVRPVDMAAAAGAGRILLTCAAGGIRPDLAPGDLVLVSDHLNLMGWLPPLGEVPFLDLSQVYDLEGSRLLAAAAEEAGQDLAHGVLAAVRGPVYETPAEVRMLAALGADLVSMSTVPEAIRARALGMQVTALACIANHAAGQGRAPLDHGLVLKRVGGALDTHGDWLLAGLARWAALQAG